MQIIKVALKTRIFISIFLCGILVFWSFQASGEQWTEAQKEVLRAIEARWEKLMKADLKGLEASIHDDSIMWRPKFGSPVEKDISINHDKRWMSYDPARPVSYEIDPYSIQIFAESIFRNNMKLIFLVPVLRVDAAPSRQLSPFVH